MANASDFTQVGYTAEPGEVIGGATQWYCGADQDGFGGNPWTNLTPESGYDIGWADPSIIEPWGTTQSMDLGY